MASSTCNCITENPVPSRASVRLEVGVTAGSNLVLRSVGSFAQIYHDDQSAQFKLSLAAGAVYTVTGGTSLLFLSVSGPVTVALTPITVGGTVISMTVNSLLVQDGSWASVTLTNPGTTAVDVNMVYLPYVAP